MMEFEAVIPAGRETVYDVFTNARRWPAFVSGIAAVGLPEGTARLKPGVRFTETRVMFGREATETFEVVELEPGRLMTLHSESCGALYVCRHRFDDHPHGTRVRLSIETTPVTRFARLMMPLGRLMQGPMRKAISQDLDDFAAECGRAAAV